MLEDSTYTEVYNYYMVRFLHGDVPYIVIFNSRRRRIIGFRRQSIEKILHVPKILLLQYHIVRGIVW